MRVALVGALAALLLGPATCLVGLAVVMNPAAQATCLPNAAAGLGVGEIPNHVDATTRDGTRIRVNHRQLTNAATIIDIGGHTAGVGRDGVTVALMAALTESSLRMLSNTAAHPASGTFPNDGDGGDHDSLGLLQMRPSTGWGSVAQLMDPTYQARAFFGGPDGPNHGSPRGLLDIPGWTTMPKAGAAQAVERSAHPDRYASYEPVAHAVLTALTRGSNKSGPVPQTGRVVFPLPNGTWVRTNGFGMRRHPVTGIYKLHTGVDYAAPTGTPILAVADGRVVFAGPTTGYGNLILITHTVAGRTVTSGYAHMNTGGVHVRVSDTVTAGQHIGDVGSSGFATGPHLHFEIRPGGPHAEPIDPEPWLATQRAATVDDPGTGETGGCAAGVPGPGAEPGSPPEPSAGSRPDRLVDDPTSDGRITARTAHALAQIRTRFPSSSWSCWSPRPGTASEHPLGRACDGTFGNTISRPAAGAALDLGWTVTNWLKTNARTLGVEYLIWQGRIWSLARASEGWRPYAGGGMHDPSGVTGGHYDHLHFTIRAGR